MNLAQGPNKMKFCYAPSCQTKLFLLSLHDLNNVLLTCTLVVRRITQVKEFAKIVDLSFHITSDPRL